MKLFLNKGFPLFVFQNIALSATLFSIYSYNWVDFLPALLIYFVTGCLGVSCTLHRNLSHRSYTCPKWFENFGIFASIYGGVGSPLAWVNNHRAHHRYVDSPKDPHSPSFLGFIKVQWLSMLYSYKNLKFVLQYKNNSLLIVTHKYYYLILLGISLFIFIFLGLKGLCLYFLFPSCLLWNMGSLINTLCHKKIWLNYRNFDTKDFSQNNLFLGVFLFGEGWHNNHHCTPNGSNFSVKPWEIDISYELIKRISK